MKRQKFYFCALFITLLLPVCSLIIIYLLGFLLLVLYFLYNWSQFEKRFNPDRRKPNIKRHFSASSFISNSVSTFFRWSWFFIASKWVSFFFSEYTALSSDLCSTDGSS